MVTESLTVSFGEKKERVRKKGEKDTERQTDRKRERERKKNREREWGGGVEKERVREMGRESK